MSTHFVRSACLSGYVRAARDVGLDPHAMLKKLGLPLQCLEDPDVLISQDLVLRLLENSAKASGHSDFGTRASIARGVPDLGRVSLLLREAETIEEAFQTINAASHLNGDGAPISIDDHLNRSFVGVQIKSSRGVPTSQGTEFAICGLVMIVRWLIGTQWKPQAVCFAHSSTGTTQVQRTFFRAPVRYQQNSSGILIDRATLYRKVETSVPFLRRQVKSYLAASLELKPADFSSRVMQVIAQMLPRSSCSADNVARVFDIDRRTLIRRLKRDGNSYASLLQTTRSEIAQRLIADVRLSLTDATEVTGFRNLSSFSRWFRTTFGHSATQWRQDTRQSARPGASRKHPR